MQGASAETGQKLDLLDRNTELGALENVVGSGDAGGVLMAIGAGRSRNRLGLVRRPIPRASARALYVRETRRVAHPLAVAQAEAQPQPQAP